MCKCILHKFKFISREKRKIKKYRNWQKVRRICFEISWHNAHMQHVHTYELNSTHSRMGTHLNKWRKMWEHVWMEIHDLLFWRLFGQRNLCQLPAVHSAGWLSPLTGRLADAVALNHSGGEQRSHSRPNFMIWFELKIESTRYVPLWNFTKICINKTWTWLMTWFAVVSQSDPANAIAVKWAKHMYWKCNPAVHCCADAGVLVARDLKPCSLPSPFLLIFSLYKIALPITNWRLVGWASKKAELNIVF